MPEIVNDNMASSKKSLSIVIPTFNEAQAIISTLKSYTDLKLGRRVDIIVVDDSSRDGTGDLVRKFSKRHLNVRLVVRKNDTGFGSALRAGAMMAKGDYVLWTMADGCDDLNAVPKMLAMLDKGYDIVVASRNMAGGKRGDQPILKLICSWGFCQVMKVGFGVGISDSTNANRAFKRSILKRIALVSNDFSISPEMILKAKRAKLKVGETPVKYKERSDGASKFKLMKMGKSFTRVLARHVLRK